VTVRFGLVVRRSGATGPGGANQLTVRMPSDLSVIEEAIELVTGHCVDCLPDRATFNVRVALGEALANAIQYGNREDPTKHVEMRVRVDSRRIEIHVRDQGDGFDPTTVPDPTLPERVGEANGRGIFLIRQLVDDVSFNDRGNAICMVLNRV
jgi:serine/threonine-protein kinase RsbW